MTFEELKVLFPSGELSWRKEAFMVKEGCYYHAAAIEEAGSFELTEFGKKLSGAAVPRPVIKLPKKSRSIE